MKFSCDVKRLQAALQLVGSVIPAKSPREILQNVLIHAEDSNVHFVGTDLEVGIRFILDEVNVEKEGTILANAFKLTQIVREANAETVEFESEESVDFKISYASSNYSMKGFDPEEYPELPDFAGEYVEMDAPTLLKMIRHTSFAAARESMRFAINGVLFVVEDATAHMVGTDGHRLGWIKKPVEIAGDVSFKGIVPLKALDVLERMLEGSEEEIKLKFEESYILAQSGSGHIVSKLVEGTYPNYEDVIPHENDKRAIINADELRSAVRQAAILTSDESRAVRTSFEDNLMTMTSRIPDRGGSVVTRQINYEGGPVKIGFNPEYLIDVLKVTEESEIVIELMSKDRPALIKTGPDYLYVVMPVSIEE